MPKVIKHHDAQSRRHDDADTEAGDEGLEELQLSDTGFDRLTAGCMRMSNGGARRLSPPGRGPDADDYTYDNY